MFNKLLTKLKAEKDSKKILSSSESPTNSTLDLTKIPFPKKYLTSLFSQKSKICSIYYTPSFLSLKDQKTLQNFIKKNQKNYKILKKARRKVQKYGGDVTKKGLSKKTPLPKILKKISIFFQKNKIAPILANHVLINEYQKNSGIMPHTDGPLYHPYTFVISLGSSCVLEFYKDYECYKKKNVFSSFFIEKGSLYIFEKNAYQNFLHCIRDISFDSIFLKLKVFGDKFEILESNVENFFLTRIYKDLIIRDFKDLLKEEVFVVLKGNAEFNYCLDVKRDVRVSLTFRKVPDFLDD